ncbi:MAG: FHA domain-containing protein [Planctomycetota bacterium]
MLKAKLVVVGGDAKSTEVNLKLPTVIGRGKEAGLTVPHALVSRRHTEIVERDGRLVVRDLGSLNGTFVNNTKIESEVILEPNQLLTLGNITFRAVYEIGSQIDEVESETITFEAAPTVEQPQSEQPTDSSDTDSGDTEGSISDIVSFDEAELGESAEPKLEPKKAATKTPAAAKKSPVKERAAKKVPAVKETAALKKKPVKPKQKQAKSKPVQKSPASNTPADLSDSIDFDSAEFDFGEDVRQPDKVSPSALDHLPGVEDKPSFIDSIDLGDDVDKPKSEIDSVKIDLGEEAPAAADVDDDRLNSFLKKLPQ